jgi:putative transposase
MELRHKYDLEVLLNCMKMVRSSYYYYEKRSHIVDKYKDVKELIKQIYNHHKGRLGYRRITLAIKQKGIVINHKTVLRLMRILGLKSLIRIKKYKSYKGEQGKIAPNIYNVILKRQTAMKNGQLILQNLMYLATNYICHQLLIYLTEK